MYRWSKEIERRYFFLGIRTRETGSSHGWHGYIVVKPNQTTLENIIS